MEQTELRKSGINAILIPLLAIGVVFALGYKGFGWENYFRSSEVPNIINSFTSTTDTNLETDEAWQVFEKYLEFARTHNLEGVKSLSHQISATCSDPLQTEECNALMDSVYAFAKNFRQSDFKYVQGDGRQIIMWTDGPVTAILFFTKDTSGLPKVLGLRFCITNESGLDSCIETDPAKRDLDGNGWWDKVESLFY